jgi:hypothetical protein
MQSQASIDGPFTPDDSPRIPLPDDKDVVQVDIENDDVRSSYAPVAFPSTYSLLDGTQSEVKIVHRGFDAV